MEGPAKLPPNFGNRSTMFANCSTILVNRTRDVTADAATRWLDGMSREDVKKITKEFGKHLEKFAVEAYKTAESNVKPQVTPTNNE